MTTSAQSGPTTSDRLANVLSYGALLLLGYVVYLIVEPFLVPLAWSAVLAIFFYPMYKRLARHWSPVMASLASTLTVTFVLIVPALLILLLTARQGLDASAGLQKTLLENKGAYAAHFMNGLRHLLPTAWQNTDFSQPLRQAAESTAAYLAGKVGSLLGNLVSFLFGLLILLFALFFMFRDGDAIVRAVRHLLPFDAAIQDDMVRESGDLIFASVAVSLVIATVQGTLGGIAFAIVRLPNPFFWGVLIAFFSFVPVVGSSLICVPAMIWLVITGHWVKALIVGAICGGVASVVDSILRPLLLHNRTQLNSLLLFVSVLGGLRVFGMLGLVVGPTIMAAAMGIFRVYMEHSESGASTAA